MQTVGLYDQIDLFFRQRPGIEIETNLPYLPVNENNLVSVSYTHLDVYKRQDCGLFTCNPLYGEDATAVFNMLSGYSEPLGWNRLAVAPLWLRDTMLRRIRREKENAENGKKAHIIAKMNSLCDKEIIGALYEASCAGVKIELIIRGICCLKAGVSGLSENISVRSIVGNFLEHSLSLIHI